MNNYKRNSQYSYGFFKEQRQHGPEVSESKEQNNKIRIFFKKQTLLLVKL